MKAKFFTIEVLSNLHVGNGEINYGLIDNLIQRDPVTELPNINSSSLKGALREHFRHIEKNNNKKNDSWTVRGIFGSDPKDQTNRKQGSVRFFEAELVAIPVRDDKKPYIMVTSDQTLEGLKNRMKGFSVTIPNKIEELIGNPEEKKEYNEFKDLCSDDELPVISRNNLENGQSSNLWYEQVLPKHSVLVFAVLGEDNDKAYDGFCSELNGAQVQIGANATIGYGYCLIKEIA